MTTTTIPLTERRKTILAHLLVNPRASYRELAEALACNISTVVSHLERLELSGHIKRDPGLSRSIKLTAPGLEAAGATLCDRCGGTGVEPQA